MAEAAELTDLDRNLFAAIVQNDAAAVHQALQNGANVNCVDRDLDNETPLMKACECGYNEIVSILLGAGANARWKDDEGGQPAILYACQTGKLSIVELLINHDRDLLELADSTGWTPLFEAIYSGDANTVRFLINHGANVHAITDRNSKESTTLIQACRVAVLGLAPDIEIVRLLVDAKVDLDARDEFQRTALHYAAKSDESVETVLLLWKSGASVDLMDGDRDTPLLIACSKRNQDITWLLLLAGADVRACNTCQQTTLHHAASMGNGDIVRFLLQNGASVDATDEDGDTPLLRAVACVGNDLDVTRQLVVAGADVRARNGQQRTALHYAASKETGDIVRFLLQNGASVDATDEDGDTPLLIACRVWNENIVWQLLVAGADVRARNSCHRTALHYAASWGTEDIVRFLLENGASVDATDMNGETPLLAACYVDNLDTVRLLLAAGATTTVRNRQNETPLHYATGCESVNLVQFLLQSGASVDAIDANGQTPLIRACRLTNPDIVRLLLAAGVTTTIRDSHQRLALHYAALHNSIGIVVGLKLDPNANIFAVEEGGSTPFDDAGVAVAPLFIEVYCNKMTQDHGRLALHAILCSAVYSFVFEGDYFHPPLNLTLQIRLQLGKLTFQQFRTMLQSLGTELIRNRDDIGKLPLHIACQANAPVEILSTLVDIDPSTLQVADDNGAVPIHYLLLNGSRGGPPTEYASVQYLVEQGGVDTLKASTTQYGFLPLHTYLYRSTPPLLRIVQYLIQSFPGSVASATNAGDFPFMMAACETSSASLSVVYELLRANPALVVRDNF